MGTKATATRRSLLSLHKRSLLGDATNGTSIGASAMASYSTPWPMFQAQIFCAVLFTLMTLAASCSIFYLPMLSDDDGVFAKFQMSKEGVTAASQAAALGPLK